MCIQDSRRSYRTYAYATEFNLFGGTRRYHRDYGTYTGISEHIVVLQNLYWSYGTYTCIQVRGLSDAGVPVGTIGLIQIRDLSDAEVPVGTTELIQELSETELIQIQEYP